MRTALAIVILCAVVWTVASVSADHNATSTHRSDADGNGAVNVLDLLLVASHFGETTLENPCIVAEVYTDTYQPDELIQNSLGEIVTPRGLTYRFPYGDPRYDAVRQGTPIAAYPC